jgi:hypothetical protein
MSTPLSLRPAGMPMPLAPSGLCRLLFALLAGLCSYPQFSWADGLFVSGVSPASGPTTGGTLVTINGHDFVGATAVNFGATPATSFTVINNTAITAISPAEPAGTVDITVTVDDPTTPIVLADEFTYIQTAPTPTPTLSQWSMLVLAVLLAGMGYLGLNRALTGPRAIW